MKNKKIKSTISSTINTKLVFIENEDDKELFEQPQELVMFKNGIVKATPKKTIAKMNEIMNIVDTKIKGIDWVCSNCGLKALRKKCNQKIRQHTCSTWHIGICDICGKKTAVTEHRDFGYCKF